MGLFAVCPQCGKKQLSFLTDASGLCKSCVANPSEETIRAREQLEAEKARAAEERAEIIDRVKARQAPQMGLRRVWGPRAHGVLCDYTVVDTETTGLDACTCEILEIGAVRYRSHREVAYFASYVKPYGLIPPSATEINGITESTVHRAPHFPTVYADFLNFIGDDILIGYNVEFDIKFIQTRAGEDLHNKFFDVLPFAKQVLSLDRYRLDDLRSRFLIGGDSHTALGDCRATAKVYKRLLGEYGAVQYLEDEALKAESEQKEFERIQQEYAAHLQKVKEEKARLMVNAPSQRELRQLSQQMTGQTVEYFSKVKIILKAAGIDVSAVREMCPSYNCRALYIPSENPYLAQSQLAIFFGVKLEGNLRYILLDLSPEEISCDFPCVPSSIQEGENRSRVYLSSPAALDSIAEYIIKSYQHAKDSTGK